MNRQQFLSTLKTALEDLKLERIPEILADYEEHFSEGTRQGKKEELVSAQLGSPSSIAKAYEAEGMIKQVQKKDQAFQWGLALQIMGRFILIAPFNFFILLIPGAILFALIVAGWSVTFGMGAGAVAVVCLTLKASLFSLGWWAGASAMSAGLALFGLTALFGLIGFLISQQIFLAFLSYLQWNLKFILDRREERT